MSATAVLTTAKPNAAAHSKALPPARSFAKQPRVAGRKLVRLGEPGSRVTGASFALTKEFRRPRRSDYFSPGAAPVLSRADSVFVLGPGQYRNAVASGESRKTQYSSVSNAQRRPDATALRYRLGVIQFAQLPANQVVVPPALPLHRPIGKVVATHELRRIDATSITSTGAPLPVAVRNPLARTFSVDLMPIRVHTDASAQRVVRSLSTRAFAYGNHIFLGPGEQPTDLRLMAHEVAHVVQQSHSATLQHFTPAAGEVFEQEAEAASAAAVRGAPFTVRERTAPRPQGLFGISLPNPLTWLMNRANSIPGFRMLTIILGQNPINGTVVPRSAANILRALVEFFPGGELVTQALDNYGIFDRVGHWVEEQINSLGMTAGVIRDAVTEFISSLSPTDLLHLGGLLDRAIRIFTTPIDRLLSFGRRIVTGIVSLIKDAVLQPLARLASQTRGWNLLIAVLGRNPITGEEVPRNAETLIGGFMRLIGQEEVWTNIQRARVVPRAWAWFQGALEGLISLVRDIPSRFVSELRQLEVIDIIILPRLFMRIGRVFTGFLGSFLPWAGNQVLALLQIIFEGVAPQAMPYIRRTGGALATIFRNPGNFARNLVRAGVQGFRQFKDNFLNHLRRSLIEWLTGAMSGAGLYIPQAFNFREILKFVLSVLGLTWQNVRAKLVRAIGPTAVSVLETTFDIVVTLVREGPAAAWERIRESISNLREMVMEQIMTMVRERIVVAAITMLASSLVPGAGFIRAIISIYDTVMFFVQRAQQIAQVVRAYIDSIAAIASGNIGTAANRVETTMARTLTIVISFLASILRLGRVTDAVTRIIDQLRRPIDQALDRVVEWIRTMAQRLVAAGRRGVSAIAQWWRARKNFRAADNLNHSLYFQSEAANARLILGSDEPLPVVERLQRAQRQNIRSRLVPNHQFTDAIRTVQRIQGEIQAQIANLSNTSTPTIVQFIAGKLDEIKRAIENLPLEFRDAPLTRVTYRKRGTNAQEVIAEPLSYFQGNTRGQGSESAAPNITPSWNLASLINRSGKSHNQETSVGRKRRTSLTWVRAHLLNADLHGPASDWNMIPALYEVNNGMRPIENTVKSFLGSNQNKSYPIYRTLVTFGHPDDPQEHDQAGNWNPKDFPKKVSIYYANPDQTRPVLRYESADLPAPSSDLNVDIDFTNLKKASINNEFRRAKNDGVEPREWRELSWSLNLARDIPNRKERRRVTQELYDYYYRKRNRPSTW